jgi:hypothetical protein
MKPVAGHLVDQHPGMPGVGQAKETVSTARGVVYRLHAVLALAAGSAGVF